jgi:hypothetical protein
MRRLQQQFFTLGPPDWLKMKNPSAAAVTREAAMAAFAKSWRRQ